MITSAVETRFEKALDVAIFGEGDTDRRETMLLRWHLPAGCEEAETSNLFHGYACIILYCVDKVTEDVPLPVFIPSRIGGCIVDDGMVPGAIEDHGQTHRRLVEAFGDNFFDESLCIVVYILRGERSTGMDSEMPVGCPTESSKHACVALSGQQALRAAFVQLLDELDWSSLHTIRACTHPASHPLNDEAV